MAKRALIGLLMAGSLASFAAAQQNPIDNRFFLTDYFNGIETKVSKGYSPVFKMANTFSLGNIGKIYAQAVNTDGITLNYHKDNCSLEAVIGEKTTFNLSVKKDNITFGVSSDKSVNLSFLNTDGYKVINGLLWYPYAKFDLGINGPKATIGTMFMIDGSLTPYIVVEKGEKTISYIGVEFNTKRFMVALRGEVSKDEKKAILDVGVKF